MTKNIENIRKTLGSFPRVMARFKKKSNLSRVTMNYAVKGYNTKIKKKRRN